VRRKQLLTSLLLLIVAAVAFAGLTPSQAQQSAKPLITVLNPAIESKMVDRIPLSPRLDTLEGKTIYLVDLQWGGPEAAYSVYEEMKAWFARNMPAVKVEIRRSQGGWMGGDDPGLRKEIADKKAAGVMIGIGG